MPFSARRHGGRAALGHDRDVHVVAEALAWWSLCFGLWLLTLSSVTTEDVALALAAGLLSALCAVVGRKLTGGRWAVRWRWSRWFATLPVTVLSDTVGVLSAAYRLHRPQGSTGTITLPRPEAPAVTEGRAALSSLALSAAPASYVFDRDPEERVLHLRRAGTFGPSWARPDPSGD